MCGKMVNLIYAAVRSKSLQFVSTLREQLFNVSTVSKTEKTGSAITV